MSIRELREGDLVMALDASGALTFSPVLLFLDRDPTESTLFVVAHLASGRSITLTPYHLLYVLDKEDTNDTALLATGLSTRAVFAKQAAVGQYLLATGNNNKSAPVFDEITRLETKVLRGVYAPLTAEGNLFVNSVLASSYAALPDQSLAHKAFLPLRLWSNFKDSLTHISKLCRSKWHSKNKQFARKSEQQMVHGVHWYPSALYKLGKLVLPPNSLE